MYLSVYLSLLLRNLRSYNGFIHVEDLQDKDGKGNPAARQGGKGKVGEE